MSLSMPESQTRNKTPYVGSTISMVSRVWWWEVQLTSTRPWCHGIGQFLSDHTNPTPLVSTLWCYSKDFFGLGPLFHPFNGAQESINYTRACLVCHLMKDANHRLARKFPCYAVCFLFFGENLIFLRPKDFARLRKINPKPVHRGFEMSVAEVS